MKYMLLVAAFLISFSVQAQIANSDFENWYTDSTGKARLTGWEHLIQGDHTNPWLFGTYESTYREHGQFALTISRWYNYTYDVVRQYAPLSSKPSALSGYYKYTGNNVDNYAGVRTLDTALVEVYLTKWNSALNRRETVGSGNKDLALNPSFTQFFCPLNYVSILSPDSILIHFQPSKFDGTSAASCSDSGWCSFLTIDNLALEQSTGIGALQSNYIRVYPNPVSNVLFIDLKQPEACMVTATDMLGKIIMRCFVISGNAKLDVSNWSSGIYFVSFKGNNFNEEVKLQKQ